jgi:hypothetical protein
MIVRVIRVLIVISLFWSINSFSQITVVKNQNNIDLIGKINLENANASSFLPPKIKVDDGLIKVWNKEINLHHLRRKEANSFYSTLSKSGTLFFGDLSASIVYVEDRNLFLLTFLNRSHDYLYESFWITSQSFDELYNFISVELNKGHKWKNYEILTQNNVVLILSFHKKKMNFNLYDHYKWYNSGWFKQNKVNNLFGKD